ncbi:MULTISPECIES: PQQ-dependent sugar dehydrogenase [Micromonospora]|uniref:Glucose/arabinose dehydrogenase, beta-propeller fold n=1 Tax=Micromonospora yangpuensis TaxID=683228 RepID=A0A1C6UHR1_9ACTN|nr:PQQ-dependent sugar dehydrogenase [Micromonospora yangpuensis]GGM03906.1 oxidoreductase [Micromonospora yangpuensis]SCL53484.1 Glucose/arabinose dehydrogenase, beta-propeller fold [Micromonospora yangpuensis]
MTDRSGPGRGRLLLAGVLTVALLAGVAGFGYWRGWFADPSVSDAPQARPGDVEVLATGLEAPWGLAFLPDGSALVTERDSTRILALTDGQTREVGRVPDAAPGGEGGLLGIAVSPDHAQDGWIYVYYTTAQDNRIARMQAGGTPEPVFTGIPRASTHNGGRIAFGPDGMLYAGTGDAGDRDSAQDRDSLGGKILRLTPQGQPAPGNPFGDSPVYSYGHRNVQGLAWDSAGTLFAAEFGQNRYDELNRITPGGNYGWPEVEGDSDDERYEAPVATWATGDASPSGIAVVDDEVWMACLRGERLYRLGTDGQNAQALLVEEYGRLRHVAPAPDGSLWVLTNNRDGRGSPGADDDRILRLEP